VARIAIIEHEAQCPPAHVGTWLTDAGATLDVRRPWAGDELPDLDDGCDGIVVLGGSMGAGDDELHHWLAPLKQLVRDAVAREVPLLGICLGHQLIAAALGGTVEPNPHGQQVGLYAVGWLPAAGDDELVAGYGEVRGVQWNHDVVTRLPAGAVALAETEQGELQVARFGPCAWGVQLHPEVDEPVVTSWAAGDRDDHLHRGIDQAALIAQIRDAREELDQGWQPLAARFLALLGETGGRR
jgi:GMP synthase (glutamine-hydrolysing)